MITDKKQRIDTKVYTSRKSNASNYYTTNYGALTPTQPRARSRNLAQKRAIGQKGRGICLRRLPCRLRARLRKGERAASSS